MDVEVLQEASSSGVSEDHPVAQALAEPVQTVVGERPALPRLPGASEIRWYAGKGIPRLRTARALWKSLTVRTRAIEIERIYQHTLVYALTAVRLLS